MNVKEKETPTIKRIFQDRKRTSLLVGPEHKLISFLVTRVPKFVTPNILTAIGMLGSVLVFLGFVCAHLYHHYFLFLCPIGLFINWLGDSLDGRTAYYRNISRKWYGFSLDIIMDWASTALIGIGYFFYAPQGFKIVAFIFALLYGWAIIITQLRYKVTDAYTIDSGVMGPTEIRVLLALIISLEYFVHGSLNYIAAAICILFFIVNIIETRKLLKLGDERDARERLAKKNKEATQS